LNMNDYTQIAPQKKCRGAGSSPHSIEKSDSKCLSLATTT
jgi:hypothetical protein